MTPDFIKVFRYTGVNGETPEQLAEVLKRGELLISENLLDMNENIGDITAKDLLGKEVYVNWDTTKDLQGRRRA